MNLKNRKLNKIKTGIKGFDFISNGGLPKNRVSLLSGTAGSGKTIFAIQYLIEGIRQFDEPGVFVTFEEKPENIRKNMLGFGWNIEELEKENKWIFVDASPEFKEEFSITGAYDLGALLARIEHAIKKIGAKRVSLDSLGAIIYKFGESKVIRNELLRISLTLQTMKVTTLLTSERINEFGNISRFGIEEFVADNVLILRNVLENEKRRRTIEILKFRGTSHQKGEFPFSILPNKGVIVVPLSAIELKQKSTDIRITSGNSKLDEMCGGGFYRDSIILISGATGTGKTLSVTQFIRGGTQNNEKCLLFAFEESKDQLFRNAKGWGINFKKMEEEGLLKIECSYPEVHGLEDHLIHMKELIEEFKPKRIAIDSLSALERGSNKKSFREFVIGITSFIKHKDVVGLFTSTTPSLLGGTSITEAHISTITDSIILLRYIEYYGEMKRGITVLKMRGSKHDKTIREFSIDQKGMHIKHPFRSVTGILSGNQTALPHSEMDRINELFEKLE